MTPVSLSSASRLTIFWSCIFFGHSETKSVRFCTSRMEHFHIASLTARHLAPSENILDLFIYPVILLHETAAYIPTL